MTGSRLRPLTLRISLAAMLLATPQFASRAATTETTLGEQPAVKTSHATESLLLGLAGGLAGVVREHF